MESTAKCTFPGCDRDLFCKGLCNGHYDQRRKGRKMRPLRPYRPAQLGPAQERLYASVEKSDAGCWVWTAYTSPYGYGQLRVDGKAYLAHRLAWELEKGPVPDGMFIDHMCHNRACVRVDHLQVVTNKENSENQRGATPRSTTGVRGVFWSAPANKYRVQVGHNGESHHGGLFESLEDAEAAAVALRNKLFTNNLLDRAP